MKKILGLLIAVFITVSLQGQLNVRKGSVNALDGLTVGTTSDTAKISKITYTGNQIKFYRGSNELIPAGVVDTTYLSARIDSMLNKTGTAWRILYRNTSGLITELALGAAGSYLGSNGASSPPTFSTPAGSGEVAYTDTISVTGFVETQFRVDTMRAALRDSVNALRADIESIVVGEASMVYPGAGIPLSTGSAWGTSITNNSANWNTAYGWGNHANAGYATLLQTSTIAHDTSEAQIDRLLANGVPMIAAGDSNVIKPGGYVTVPYLNEQLANTGGSVDSSLYVTVTRLADSLAWYRNQINYIIANMGNLPIPVSSINVASLSGATTIATDGGSLDFEANVEPDNAADTTITWSYIAGTGTATFETEDGAPTLTALTNGTVTVRATANDGSAVYGDREITISNQSGGLVYTDDFEAYTPADTLGGQGYWVTALFGQQVIDEGGDNRIKGWNTSSTALASTWYNRPISADHSSQVVLDFVGTNAWMIIGVRVSGTRLTNDYHGYLMEIGADGAIILYSVDNDTYTSLATGTVNTTLQVGDVFKIAAEGSVISCYQNGSLITSLDTDGMVTNTDWTTGFPAVGSRNDNVGMYYDDWEGAEIQ